MHQNIKNMRNTLQRNNYCLRKILTKTLDFQYQTKYALLKYYDF